MFCAVNYELLRYYGVAPQSLDKYLRLIQYI